MFAPTGLILLLTKSTIQRFRRLRTKGFHHRHRLRADPAKISLLDTRKKLCQLSDHSIVDILVSITMINFESDLLRNFLELCTHGSFSRAAEKLRKSQSGLSTQIAMLEDQAGTKFFDRSQRPLRLTETGMIFFHFATEVLNKTEELDRQLKEHVRGMAGEVRIAAIPSVGAFLLPNIVAQILKTLPKINFIISVQPASLVYQSVRQSRVDFAIVLTDRLPENLVVRRLRRERLCFVVSKNHTLAQDRNLAFARLRSIPFVVGPAGGGYTEMINRLFEKRKLLTFQIAVRIASFEGIKESVRAGLGLGILPEFMVQREIVNQDLVELFVNGFRLSADIILVERPRYTPTPTAASVKALIERQILAS
jgi:DNA-binding transcriptional LysR family regulator